MRKLTFAMMICSSLLTTPFIAQAEGTWQRFTRKNSVYDVLPVDSMVWCATSGGMARFHPDTGEFEKFGIEDGLPSYSCSKLAQHPDGTIYAISGTEVVYFDGVLWHTTGFNALEGSPEANDLIVLENGMVWVASRRGVYRFDGVMWSYKGLDRCTSITCDGNHIWAVSVTSHIQKTTDAQSIDGDPYYVSTLYRLDDTG